MAQNTHCLRPKMPPTTWKTSIYPSLKVSFLNQINCNTDSFHADLFGSLNGILIQKGGKSSMIKLQAIIRTTILTIPKKRAQIYFGISYVLDIVLFKFHSKTIFALNKTKKIHSEQKIKINQTVECVRPSSISICCSLKNPVTLSHLQCARQNEQQFSLKPVRKIYVNYWFMLIFTKG